MTPAQRRTSTRRFRSPVGDLLSRGKSLTGRLARLGAFVVMFGLLAAGLYSAASASSSRVFSAGGGRRAEVAAPEASAAVPKSQARTRRAAAPASPAAGLLPAMLFQTGEVITTYESDCTTPSDLFELGDTVCARVSGAQLGSGGNAARRVNWVARTGSVALTGDVTNDPQTFSFTLPSSETTLVTDAGGGTITVDNRGVWRVYIADAAEASFRTGATFTVLAPTPYVDLEVSQSATVANARVAPGSTGIFEVFVTNAGPNAAANVVVSDTLPANTTFVSQSESTNVGFTCTPPATAGDPSVCTVASMPVGSTARLLLAYTVDAGTAAGTVLTNTASATSATAELEPGDNTASFDAAVPTESGPESCTLICHEDMVVTANASQGGNPGAFVTFGAATGAGECGTVNASPASGTFFPVGTTIVNVTSQTGGGSCSFTVNVTTTAAPTISCPADKSAADDGSGSANVNVGTPTAAPSGVSVAGVRDDGAALNAPYPVGTTAITWTATDSFGRTATCTQRITVTGGACPGDTTPPVITAPANISVGTGADSSGCSVAIEDSELGEATATDDCPSGVTITRTGVPAGGVFPKGTTVITYTATDTSGLQATATQTVTVVDDTKPIIVAPADAAYTCLSAVPAANPSQATRGVVLDEDGQPLPPGPPFDNCGVPAVTVTETSSGAGSAASPRIITRTFRATDSTGNFSEAVQTITVTDPTAPTLSVPANITVGNDPGSCSAVVNFAVTASDNCNADGVTVQTSPASGSVFQKGTTTVTATATDWAGNTTTQTFNVTVNDTEAPTISYPSGGVTAQLPLNSPATSMAVSYTVTAADNCPGVTLNVSPASGSVFNVGTTTVTATATDASGNTTVRTFTVTVLYNFTGFFSPVSNLPTLNKANGGQNIPIKFSLSGNKGLAIFAAGYPASQQVSCSDSAPINNLEEAESPGSNTLTYSPDQYHFNWKTEKSWGGTCRMLVVKLNDGSTHTALFKFK